MGSPNIYNSGARCVTGRYDLAFEFIAVADAMATGRWNSKFWVLSVYVST